jgi:hydrogenase maturation protein HypF
VLGVVLDGTGHGDDGAVWGGEVLLADYAGYQRLAHLSYVPLAGGDAAVRRPYRMALAHLHAAGVGWEADLPCVAVAPDRERSVLAHQLRTGLACVATSSMGRLVDAVASLAGVCHEVGYEGQAALEFQSLAVHADADGAYPLPLVAPASGPLQWDCGALVRAVADDVRAGVPAEVVAVRFHRGVAAAVVRVALHARGTHGVSTVALTGEVFTNGVLLSLTSRGLREAGFEVLRHRRVPANDGGLALGQAVVGATPAVHVVDLAEATANR